VRPSLEELIRTTTEGDGKASGSRIGNPDTKAHPGVSLTDATAREWATPNTMEGGQTSRGGDRKGELLLGGQVREEPDEKSSLASWRTPTTEDCEQTGARRTNDPTLTSQARDWPTVTARDCESPAKVTRGANASPGGTPLVVAVENWPTPTVQDSENTAGPSQFGRNSIPPNALVAGPPAPEKSNTSGKNRGSLNSRWVAQLMGFPSDWCDLSTETLSALSETRSSRKSSK
jgi:hypothetical protein